jgi:hypothetical protein
MLFAVPAMLLLHDPPTNVLLNYWLSL